MRAVARQLKRGAVDLYWMFRGPRIRVPAIPSNARSILFVCKNNICRSPFAEHLAAKLAGKGALSGIRFGSAGLDVPKPTSSPDSAIRVGKQFGVDLSSHRSQPISLDLVTAYDMIVAMEAWQYKRLQSLFPQQHQKVFLLPLLDLNGRKAEWGYHAFNISDPYGSPASDFELCFERISRCLKNLQMTIKPETAKDLRHSELGEASVSAEAN